EVSHRQAAGAACTGQGRRAATEVRPRRRGDGACCGGERGRLCRVGRGTGGTRP
ncbi:MAG: hypothetical protein AVDCRST_MAG75-1553, partial [uncultured Propionibacteriaceae bacterium]